VAVTGPEALVVDSLAKREKKRAGKLAKSGKFAPGPGKQNAKSGAGGASRPTATTGRSGKAGKGKGKAAPGVGVVPKEIKPDDGEQLFQFKTLVDVGFSVWVRTPAGQPLPMARISVVGALTPPQAGQPIEDVTSFDAFFDGFSDEMGRVSSTLLLPVSVEQVDVVVVLMDYTGEYTHEQFRAFWGPFAPAARVTVSVNDLKNLALVLDDS
jgi:hypothetical protein